MVGCRGKTWLFDFICIKQICRRAPQKLFRLGDLRNNVFNNFLILLVYSGNDYFEVDQTCLLLTIKLERKGETAQLTLKK